MSRYSKRIKRRERNKQLKQAALLSVVGLIVSGIVVCNSIMMLN